MTLLDRCIAGLLGATLACTAALAAAQSPQQLLKDFDGIMPRLQPALRDTLKQRAEDWAGWSAAQRKAFAQRAAVWDALPRAERGYRREQYAAWRALSVRERGQLRDVAIRFAGLSTGQQQSLRAHFDGLDRSEQRGWLLGPELGRDYPDLQPLLAQVPQAEHLPLMTVLRGMTPRQRADLGVLVQRTPPQDRAELRRELMSTAASNRDEWLWQRMQE